MSKITVAEALQVLKSDGNASDLRTVLADLGILKSLTTTTSVEHDAPPIPDHWTEGQDGRVSREKIKVGPEERASGDGATKMIRDYSDPAEQHGITLEAEKISRMLGPVASSMKSMADAVNQQSRGLDVLSQAVLSLVKKAAEEEDEEDEEDEENESEVVNIGKCVTRANFLLAKAKKAEDMADETMDEEKCNTAKAKAKAFRVKAKVQIRKAMALLKLAGSPPELAKSVRAVAKKADINVVQEEEEEEEDGEEEEEDSAKSDIVRLTLALAKATDPLVKAALLDAIEKAKGHDAKGNQRDGKNAATGNQDDGAVKAAIAELNKAVSGFGMLQANVAQVLNTIGGISRGAGAVPALEISKAASLDVVGADEALAQINALEKGGSLSFSEAAEGREILRYVGLAKHGVVPADIVKARLQKVPAGVAEIISKIAA